MPVAPPIYTDIDGNTRRCRLCGRPGPYRNNVATHCIDCDREAKLRRDTYIRMYHMARSRATSELVNRHRIEFTELLEEKRKELSGWPQEEPEIPVIYHPSTPEEALGRAKQESARRKAERAAWKAARQEEARREEARREFEAGVEQIERIVEEAPR